MDMDGRVLDTCLLDNPLSDKTFEEAANLLTCFRVVDMDN